MPQPILFGLQKPWHRRGFAPLATERTSIGSPPGNWYPLLVGAFTDDGTRTFTGGSSSWDNGATSDQAFDGNFGIETTWRGTDYELVGLDTTQRTGLFHQVSWGWYPVIGDGWLYAVAGGAVPAVVPIGSLTAGVSKYGIRRVGTNIEYWYSADGVTQTVQYIATGVTTNPLWMAVGQFNSGGLVGPVSRVSAVNYTALGAASTVDFGGSGTSLGVGALTGASAAAFAPSAAMVGKGALAGTGAVTFTNTATGGGIGSVAGANAVIFSPSGTPVGRGAIAGSSAGAFGNGGTITGAGALAGLAATNFTLSATFTGLGTMAGTTGLGFSSAADMLGVGRLTGASVPTFIPSGTLGAPQSAVPIIGSARISFLIEGTLISLVFVHRPARAAGDDIARGGQGPAIHRTAGRSFNRTVKGRR